MAEHDYGVSTRTLNAFVYIVTIVWAANLLAPLLIEGFEVNTGVNGIMGALIGLLGAFRYQQSRNKEPRKKADRDE